MRVLVLGAYGLIGAEIVISLEKAGHDVTGFVRSKRTAARLLPARTCIEGDIALNRTPAAWACVAGFDAVVNASGALQTGLKDNVSKLQDEAISSLITACEENGVSVFVQISAPGAEEHASTEFMRSKARADARLRSSALNWVIFKPGLVIARTAYGGTALIRTLAGFPLILPVAMPDVRIQTVSVHEVGEAVALALDGGAPMRTDYDLVEEVPHSLLEIVLTFRHWLGLKEAQVMRIPRPIASFAALLGDCAGWLGWRPPLRTTALKVLQEDVVGDAGPWRVATGKSCASLRETLAAMPATLQERIFARAQVISPATILILSIFFLASGIIGLWRMPDAATLLASVLPDSAARALVVSGAALDMLLGAAILFRPSAKPAAMGMVLLSVVYLVMGTALTPALWLDPLGPFVKVLPVMALAFVAYLLLEER